MKMVEKRGSWCQPFVTRTSVPSFGHQTFRPDEILFRSTPTLPLAAAHYALTSRNAVHVEPDSRVVGVKGKVPVDFRFERCMQRSMSC
jgi:hypothetical protein